MATIRKVVRMEKFDSHAIVYVLMEDGDEEYKIFIGGNCETYFHKGTLNAFVKKKS